MMLAPWVKTEDEIRVLAEEIGARVTGERMVMETAGPGPRWYLFAGYARLYDVYDGGGWVGFQLMDPDWDAVKTRECEWALCTFLGMRYKERSNTEGPQLIHPGKTVESPERSFAEEVGVRIRLARRRLGITQEELARRIGCRPQVLGRWETGKHVPKLEALVRLAFHLDISLAMLLPEQKWRDLKADV